MDAARAAGGDVFIGRFDGLHAEAKAAVSYSANTLRAVRDRYREAYHEQLARWHELNDALEQAERRAPQPGARAAGARSGVTATSGTGAPDDMADSEAAASAAEEGAEDVRLKTLRSDVEHIVTELGAHQSELSRIDVALRTLEASWLFLERGDRSLITDASLGASPADVQMRLVEAQESERTRLAQEIHDGPAQALSNAIFQVEYIERVIDQDERLAKTELRFLSQLLRRELGEVRTFISQLRPPLLDELGLDGAVRDTVAQMTALAGFAIVTDLAAPAEHLGDAQQTVVLRVIQEGLQNVRKHAHASSATVATWEDDGNWLLEVRDDGRGFDVGAVVARGRRNFGLQFMRERAELIGATFEVRSRPDGGTVVRLAIPVGAEESR